MFHYLDSLFSIIEKGNVNSNINNTPQVFPIVLHTLHSCPACKHVVLLFQNIT